MTQEERNLLIQDLCGRLPYGVIVKKEYTFVFTNGTISKSKKIEKLDLEDIEYLISGDDCVDVLKPYLRSLSSMTENEKEELKILCDKDLSEFAGHLMKGHGLSRDGLYMFDKLRQLDWLNKHHFDYRGLIDKRLALEAKEGMYND